MEQLGTQQARVDAAFNSGQITSRQQAFDQNALSTIAQQINDATANGGDLTATQRRDLGGMISANKLALSAQRHADSFDSVKSTTTASGTATGAGTTTGVNATSNRSTIGTTGTTTANNGTIGTTGTATRTGNTATASSTSAGTGITPVNNRNTGSTIGTANTSSIGTNGTTTANTVAVNNPRLTSINERLQSQESRIADAFTTGRITANQAQFDLNVDTAIAQQLNADVGGLNGGDLASSERNQLSKQITANNLRLKTQKSVDNFDALNTGTTTTAANTSINGTNTRTGTVTTTSNTGTNARRSGTTQPVTTSNLARTSSGTGTGTTTASNTGTNVRNSGTTQPVTTSNLARTSSVGTTTGTTAAANTAGVRPVTVQPVTTTRAVTRGRITPVTQRPPSNRIQSLAAVTPRGR